MVLSFLVPNWLIHANLFIHLIYLRTDMILPWSFCWWYNETWQYQKKYTCSGWGYSGLFRILFIKQRWMGGNVIMIMIMNVSLNRGGFLLSIIHKLNIFINQFSSRIIHNQSISTHKIGNFNAFFNSLWLGPWHWIECFDIIWK